MVVATAAVAVVNFGGPLDTHTHNRHHETKSRTNTKQKNRWHSACCARRKRRTVRSRRANTVAADGVPEPLRPGSRVGVSGLRVGSSQHVRRAESPAAISEGRRNDEETKGRGTVFLLM